MVVKTNEIHFGVGAPPILVYFSGDWDVDGILTHGQINCWQVDEFFYPKAPVDFNGRPYPEAPGDFNSWLRISMEDPTVKH